MNEEDEFNEPEPVFDADYSNIIIIDGIPKIPEKKIPKLQKFITKQFAQFAQGPDGIVEVMIATEPGAKLTPGYCFIEFATKEMAAAALAKNNARFDSKHTMKITLFSEYDEIVNASEEYHPPEKTEYKAESRNLNSWLTDAGGRDQLVIRYAKETNIAWNEPHRRNNEGDNGVETFYDGSRHKIKRGACWTESYTHWSPKGTYLATFHSRGILIWGGPDFQEIARFEHAGVSAIDFSPCENFIVTANWKDKKTDKQQDCFIVWDIKKKILAGKRGIPEGEFVCRGFNKEASNSWPAFQWSPDDKFFSRVGENVIHIYETPSFARLKKKPLPVPGVQEATWSPRSNILAYWIPEKKNKPATVALRAIPSGELVREKHLYSVFNITMHWQPSGDFLCVKLSRRKTKKTYTTNFELFRMKEKNIPVEVIDLADPVIADVAWQPKGAMFSVIHSPQAGNKTSVTFYQVKKKKTVPIDVLPDRNVDTVRWSPAEQVCVLANMQNGNLEFYDLRRKDSVQAEHFKITRLDWDPTGRYLLTLSAQLLGNQDWQYASENGYKIWTFQGDLLSNISKDTLYQVMWRPRPKTLLSPKQIADTKKNLRSKYWARFEAEESKLRASRSSEMDQERMRMKEAWKKYRKQCDHAYLADSQHRKKIRGCDSDNEDDWEVQETNVQTLISLAEEQIL